MTAPRSAVLGPHTKDDAGVCVVCKSAVCVYDNKPDWSYDQLDRIEKRIEAIADNQAMMQATLGEILDRFQQLVGEIKPMIDKISEHPMARMLGIRKD